MNLKDGYVHFNQDPEAYSDDSISDTSTENQDKKELIRVDGFKQVLEMLHVADADFRNSLIRRISSKDPKLGAQLKRSLGL